MPRGLYGSEMDLISSSVSLRCVAAAASLSASMRVEPMMGAVTFGFARTQAVVTCNQASGRA